MVGPVSEVIDEQMKAAHRATDATLSQWGIFDEA